MKDNKLRCRCSGELHGCACTVGGRPVPTPATLPGRLAGVRPLTASGAWTPVPGNSGMVSRTVRHNGVNVTYRRPATALDRPLVASTRRRAVQEDVMRSQPVAVRRAAGLPATPPERSRVWTSAAVPWRTGGVLTASAMRQPFHTPEAADAAVKAFEQAAAVIAHGESGSLPGEPLSGAQEGLVHAYAKLMTAGEFEIAARVMDNLRRSAARVRQDRMRAVMAGLESRVKGEAGALVASARRRQVARLDVAADRILGPERAGRARQMRALRQRVDRLRQGARPGGPGAAA